MTVFEKAVRPWLFRIGKGDAETAHEWTLHRLARLGAPVRKALASLYKVDRPVRVFGVDFPNPVGLAAGMDKNGIALSAWPALGFGFVEVGTVTAHAQPGNEKPRVFRDIGKQAVINRMGFNNAGAAALASKLMEFQRTVPLGISLGKSKITPLDEAVADYRASYDLLAPYADYIAINVSSPNTPGLRQLQDKSHLEAILRELKGDVPLLVKIAPDLTEAAIAEALEVSIANGVKGIIATNTTIAHDGPQGGLSGKPLTQRAREVVSFVHKESGLPVIGVGGIMTADDASRMFDAGASLIQLYTGFIYHGPALVKECVRGYR
ncbi:quinone-dependent dihydroorotate dehydrogenase [Catelliglobosispora koreensis]|uniref:quinone-dependent dihydroorotate dehydrogenase n=1 Tax=Catelliglobosispora koreensis TaxID=129052 RepID=UPI00036F0EAB|nr:quinone-dependent dihydroorotate dehydrogenase [Catelliglobosispora koreensis]